MCLKLSIVGTETENKKFCSLYVWLFNMFVPTQTGWLFCFTLVELICNTHSFVTCFFFLFANDHDHFSKSVGIPKVLWYFHVYIC